MKRGRMTEKDHQDLWEAFYGVNSRVQNPRRYARYQKGLQDEAPDPAGLSAAEQDDLLRTAQQILQSLQACRRTS